MVFATEFDPIAQPARARESQAGIQHPSTTNRAPSRAQNRALGLSNRNDGTANYMRVLPSSNLASSTQMPAKASSQTPSQMPLSWGPPAVRVRIDNDSNSLLLPKQPKLSLGLQLLHRLQQGSTVVTSLLVTGALAVYGSTVYIDNSTHRALVQLDELQGESQQLTSANESIKESLAEQAIKENSGLEPYEAGDVLFLAPAPLRESLTPAEPATTEMSGPLSY
jgi:hypothetical protein